MKIAEIRTLLVGKRISYYDSFSGSEDYFVIGHIENVGNSVRVREVKDKGWGIFIPKNIITTLIAEGTYMEVGEIERCRVSQTWKIQDN